MPFKPETGVFHRMPVFFGPAPGPRQSPPGVAPFDYSAVEVRSLGVRFLTQAAQLKRLLPPGFTLWGEPVVTVDVVYFMGLPWLAGRGYNMSDVKCQVVYQNGSVKVQGTLVFVRFENLTDPILSGREELGHNKLYCDIPEPRRVGDRRTVTLSWLTSPFADLSVWGLRDDPAATRQPEGHQGMLSYKYIPRTGDWGVPEAEYATLTPASVQPPPLVSKSGEGSVGWVDPRWEDLPTLYHVIGAFNRLDQIETRGAFYSERVGGGSGVATVALT